MVNYKMQAVTEFAYAKLNVYLHILGRRPDGYHELESLVVFVDLHDRLLLYPDQEWEVAVSGPMTDSLLSTFTPDLLDSSTSSRKKTASGERRLPSVGEGLITGDLITRAARRLSELADKPIDFSLKLDKHIPVAAGLGGGSCDAAACLRLLSRYWGLNMDENEIGDLALGLGADVPVCLLEKPCLVGGIGEKLEPVTLGHKDIEQAILLWNPCKTVETKTIFRDLGAGVTVDAGGSAEDLHEFVKSGSYDQSLDQIMTLTENQLQPVAEKRLPEIKTFCDDIKAIPVAQSGLRHVRMTGSGATCFALFDYVSQALAARDYLLRQRKDFYGKHWFWAGGLKV